MGYTTTEAKRLVDALQRQAAFNADNAKKVKPEFCDCGHDKNAYDRGLRQGYADMAALAAEIVIDNLPSIERASQLVPEFEADPVEWLKGQMAGDLRDFPA